MPEHFRIVHPRQAWFRCRRSWFSLVVTIRARNRSLNAEGKTASAFSVRCRCTTVGWNEWQSYRKKYLRTPLFVATITGRAYICIMGEAIKRRLKQSRFQNAQQEGMLNLFLASNHVNEQIDRVCSEYGISQQQYNILRILRGGQPDGYQCREISERMLDRAPDITRRLDGLERQGYVQRERRTDDRRVVITTITQAGLDLLDRMEEPLRSVYTYLEGKLSNDDFRELSRLCEAIYADEG